MNTSKLVFHSYDHYVNLSVTVCSVCFPIINGEASNKYIWLWDKAVAVKTKGDVQIFGIAFDITKKRMLEPYFTTKRVGKGSGLGLSVVHGVVKRCNFLLKVRSTVGRGTNFKIFLPVAKVLENFSKDKDSPTCGKRRLNILLCEDEENLLSLFNRRLTKEVFGAKTAHTGEEA